MTEWLRGNELEKRAANGDLGGTMRLGAYHAHLRQGSQVAEIYGGTEISERHRHRYEVNMAYRDQLEDRGCASPASRRTASCPRSSSTRTIPGSSASSSTPS